MERGAEECERLLTKECNKSESAKACPAMHHHYCTANPPILDWVFSATSGTVRRVRTRVCSRQSCRDWGHESSYHILITYGNHITTVVEILGRGRAGKDWQCGVT